MKIHEYQAKEILKEYGIQVPAGELAVTPENALFAALRLGPPVMVKAQILAGARGRGGGVREANSPAEARKIASRFLGKYLVTPQTSKKGMLVNKVLIVKKLDIKKEFYLGVAVDRQKGCPVIVTSRAGGMTIEEVAKKHPEKIHKEYIEPIVGLLDFQKKKLASSLKVKKSLVPELIAIISNFYQLFEKRDCLSAEINPLVLTKNNQLLALDAKLVFDDSALFRQSENQELTDFMMEDPLEAEALKEEINYVRLEGNIGCMVNGAGLAMATMDAIKLFGGKPANFLDTSRGTSPEKIKTAFQILISDPSVKVVFINIFGGILRCDYLAEGLVMAYREKKFNFPLVLRLEGTNASQGLKILKKAHLEFFRASSLLGGAKKATELSNRGGI